MPNLPGANSESAGMGVKQTEHLKHESWYIFEAKFSLRPSTGSPQYSHFGNGPADDDDEDSRSFEGVDEEAVESTEALEAAEDEDDDDEGNPAAERVELGMTLVIVDSEEEDEDDEDGALLLLLAMRFSSSKSVLQKGLPSSSKHSPSSPIGFRQRLHRRQSL